ncbi:chondroitin sulfate proteoglycan 4-like [Genypterus blacodes]|uniref:chondroitin sulfate proteoglycan 4-like n=1 Tax=Genypterus blacodes TaxID=154954 RepID=UPI003F76AA09
MNSDLENDEGKSISFENSSAAFFVIAVSFYGDGYIHVRTVEASSQTSLNVRFRTSSPSGLLFLAAGRTDFLLLELISGHLQLRLDMGSGEQSLHSEKGIHLNDLAWHSVELTHDRHNVSLIVNQNSHTSLQMPAPDVELSVEDGLFVGGAVGLNHPYLLQNSTRFRGCMDEVVFNQHNLLASMRSYSGYKSVHEVSVGCSPQFSATEDDIIGFSGSKSFISLQTWEMQQEGLFECELLPSARREDGLVLYSSTLPGGFVAIEIKDGRLVATIGNVDGIKTELRSQMNVHSNHTWYRVWLHLLPHSVQLKVGEEIVNTSLDQDLQVTQLKGPLLLGGLDEQTLGEARGSGLQASGSFIGCLRTVRVNTQLTGLPHAAVTKDITVGCKLGKPTVVVVTIGPTDSPGSDVTTHSISTQKNPRRKKIPSFLLLRKLEVAEGDTASLEPKHIKVNLDFRKLGIHPAQLMFRIEEKPANGRLRLNRTDSQPSGSRDKDVNASNPVAGEEEEDRAFSMLDLWQGRVMYVHGGSEDLRDFFTFSVFCNSKRPLPLFLRNSRLHQFDITVSPVNDAPTVSLPEGNLFTLLEKSKRTLTTDVLRVSDPDSSPSELVFSSLRNLNAEAGFLEHQDYPSRAITMFPLSDLEDGKISLVHTGVPNSRLALRVSDGQKLSNTVVLRILAVPLEQKLVNNTGLVVNQGGASVITANHLAVQVNAPNQTVDIRYNVTELPRHGELQRLHSNGRWKPTQSFSQNLLVKERIRYLSTYRGLQPQNNITDQFKCQISIGSNTTEEVIFSISVRCIHFKVTRSKMEVNGVQGANITREDLHAISKGVKLNESELYFRLLSAPKKGHLLLNHKVMKTHSTFSQKNITDGFLRYELLARLHEDTRDALSFQVFSTHANSTLYDFRINIKAESSSFTVLNKGLSILEGGSKVITKDILFTNTANNWMVEYRVTTSPRYGQIRRINLSNSTSINDDIATFTNKDIMAERIMYVHDGSETGQDSFTFQVAVYRPTKHGDKEDRNASEHIFDVSIQLVNDQRPVRVVDKVFHVARDGQRLLTLDDLRYRDDDTDFEDGWLVYTRRGIPVGDLVLVNDTNHKLYEFTQKELEQRKVLFVHRGVSFGRFVLFVSDGKHYVSGLLEVMAQDPFLRLGNSTGLMVQRGGVTTLTSANLSISSNLDIREPQEVTFEVFLPPKYGVLFFVGGDTEADAISIFTQRDLVMGRLAYRHDGSQELSDCFNVTARAREREKERSSEGRKDRRRREVQLDIGVPVKIYLESHQRPPTVLSNRPVVVAEGQNVTITREHLEVVHEDSQPSEIVYAVQSPPALGVLRRISPKKEHGVNKGKQQHQNFFQGTREPTTSFTQEDINQGLVVYQQQKQGNTNDPVLLEATNGVTVVGPIRLEMDIIPALIPLQLSNMTLDEGSSVPLTSDLIKVANHHFLGMNFLYQVIDPPRHGHLEHSRIPGMPITAFTHTELERKYVSYIHDGSDTLSDNFTFVANQTEIRKHSLPCTVHIHIAAVNDEIPVVTANRGLKIFVGSLTEIPVDDLSAEDLDTEPEGLEFIVTPPSNGHLALKSAPSRHILNFTQKHIETKQLVFIHSGAFSGGFHFQVNDGVNFAPRQIFSTVAHSLVLTLRRNHPIEVYPGSVTPITEQELQVVTNNNDDDNIRRNHTIVFSVTSAPKLGSLVQRLPDNSTRPISTFTQHMVNDGVILYDQNKPETVGWSATDSFSFTVSSLPAFLPPHNFTVLISYQANVHPQHRTTLLNNAGAVVAEGGTVFIDRSKLDASNLLRKLPEPRRQEHQVLYRIISLPRHGALSLQGQNLTRDHPDISQVTLNKFGITYIHDDSETTSDSFTFQAWVAPLNRSSASSSTLSSAASSSSFSPHYSPSSSSDLSLDRTSLQDVKEGLEVTEMFNITVTPVNDQPPLIRSRSPSMSVVVGERVVLGPENLQVEDHDTPPEELHYLVISKPNNGYLMLGERPEPVTSFTQYDVNHGRLHFIQQGEPSTGVFYFNVTDGHHSPLYKLFSLEVIKPAVAMVNNTGLSLVQGKTAVVLTTNQLAVQTNGRSQANITYSVTVYPRHGRIAMNDLEVTAFCHEDLQLGRVVYHMTDLSESEDSFQMSVTASSHGVDYGNITGQIVNVTVRPLIYLREPVRVPSGIPVKLGKGMMDASELARISRVDPVFEVISPPKHGKLVKMTYDPDRAAEVLRSFTFRDVLQGRVAIEETLSDGPPTQLNGTKSSVTTMRGHTPATALNDSFIFLLKAGNVQPAKGELHFTILPHHQMRQGPRGSNKADSPGHERTTRLPTHNRTSTGGGRGGGRGGATTNRGVDADLHPHILSHKHQNRTLHRSRPHSHWGNHSGRPLDGGAGRGHRPSQHRTPSVPVKHGPGGPPYRQPETVEVPPRPASDPLLIILPLLACLLLIIILVVLILVFRHRKEKQARTRLLRELAAIVLPTEGSPYLGRPERSVAMPSVVVTPLGPGSCPDSPPGPRRKSLAPGMTFWGPLEADRGCGVHRKVGNTYERGNRGHKGGSNAMPAVTAGFKISQRSCSLTPTLRDNQYWV